VESGRGSSRLGIVSHTFWDDLKNVAKYYILLAAFNELSVWHDVLL